MAGFRSNFYRLTQAPGSVDLWLVSIAVSLAFTVLTIFQSLDGGVLALPPTYDDIEYFRDGARRLHELQTEGILEFLRSYYADPPHSALSTLLAMLGFGLFGLVPWAAVSVNILFVILLVRTFLGVTRSLPLYITFGFAITVLFHPYFSLLVLEFRPDPLAAAFTALGCAWLIVRPDENRSAWIGGVFFGLALLAKSSTFFVTGLLFGVAFILSSFDAAMKRDWQRIFGRAWRVAIVTLAIAGVHYALAAPKILAYIYQTIWGYTSDVWKTPMPVYQQLLTYLIGGRGRFGMGWWGLLVPFLVFASCKFGNIRTLHSALRDPIIQMCGVFFVAWAFVSAAPVKSSHLGLPVAALLLVISGLCVARICKARASLALPIIAVMLTLGIADYRQPWLRLHRELPERDYIQSRHVLLNKVADMFAARPDINRSTIIFPIIAPYLNVSNLDFYLQQRGIFDTKFLGDIFSYDPADYQTKSWNYLVTFTPDNKDFTDWVPSGKIADQVDHVIRNDPTLEPLYSYPDPLRGGFINIYKKK